MPTEYTTSTTKIALVTGGSRGIGRNTVVSLAKCGVHTIFTYHSHSADADAVVAAPGPAFRLSYHRTSSAPETGSPATSLPPNTAHTSKKAPPPIKIRIPTLLNDRLHGNR